MPTYARLALLSFAIAFALVDPPLVSAQAGTSEPPPAGQTSDPPPAPLPEPQAEPLDPPPAAVPEPVAEPSAPPPAPVSAPVAAPSAPPPAAAEPQVEPSAAPAAPSAVAPKTKLLSFLPQDFAFTMSGYFRAPLRVGIRRVKGETDYHSPWLVDGGYASFNYTRLQESDWAELFLSMGTPRVTATVGLMAWLFSGSQSNTDATRPGQLGIAHAYLTFLVPDLFGKGSELEVRAGSFWDRYGYLGKYDTYMFGRLHQMGEHLKATLKLGPFDVEVVHGLGTYRENNLAEAEGGGPARGFTLLHQLSGSVAYGNAVKLGGYYIDSWTKDARTEIGHADNGLSVIGADLTLSGDVLGTLYVAASRVRAERALEIAPAIEVLHSFGGAGIVGNYLGPDSQSGTGSVFAVGAQYDYSLARLGRVLRGIASDEPVTRDLVLSVFGLYAHVDSKQAAVGPVGDGVEKMKVGTDVTFDPLSWLSLSARYDWVSEQLDDRGLSFQAVSPRITFRSQWLAKEQLFIQYSRYFYGEDSRAPAGDTAPLRVGAPDEHVVKLQAQIGL